MLSTKTKAKVLVVDDEPSILSSLSDLLESEFDVTTTTDPRRGLDNLTAGEISVLISDQRMPIMNGDEFLHLARERCSATRVLLTGFTDIEALGRAVNEGKIYAYVSKPWDPRALRTTIRNAAAEYQLLNVLSSERNLLRTLREQALMLDLANDTIVIRDSKDRVTYWNQGAQRLYGWSKEEAMGQVTHALLKTQFPESLDEIQAQLLAQGYWRGELKHVRRDGSWVIVASTWTLQRDDSPRFASVLEINHDITARKEAERKLETNQREMAERSAQLEAANKELEEFAYVASHDLRAPLRVIENASKWLEEDLREHLTDESRENMNLLRGRVRRMDKLLDDLLEYARIGRVTDSRYAETMDGDLLVKDVLALLSLEGFTLKVSPSFAGIQLRRMPLQQILMNLIGNAIKHHDKKKGCIEVTVEDSGDCYTFAVRDDGPGIPAKFHDQIFKMFQTLRPRDQVEGSGMGLAMVRKNIEGFGGLLQLESAEGQGSIFRFTWPKQQRSNRTNC